MATASDVAGAHYAQRARLAEATAAAGLALWAGLDDDDLIGSWAARLARLLRIVRGAQLAAARTATEYVVSALDAQDTGRDPLGVVRPEAFTLSASDGRPLESLLQRPVYATFRALAGGQRLPQAKATGRYTLDLILRTQVEDAGRVADGVAVAATPGAGYTRFVNPPACSRCAILAGRFYRWSAGFQRHPNCDCVHVPTRNEESALSEGLIHDPRSYFESLSAEQQDKVFTKDGAKAIRDGADPGQVVNARRGMAVSAGRTVTTEGTSRRGFARSRLGGAVRLMPEQIYRDASSREEAVRLLRLHGYLV